MKTTHHVQLAAALAALTIASGCTATHGSSRPARLSSADEATQPRISASHRRLTGAELQLTEATSTLDALRRLRPDFLAPRLIASPSGNRVVAPTVYLNGIRQGGLDALYSIPIAAVREIRFVNARGMREWLGPNHASDAIVVRTIP